MSVYSIISRYTAGRQTDWKEGQTARQTETCRLGDRQTCRFDRGKTSKEKEGDQTDTKANIKRKQTNEASRRMSTVCSVYRRLLKQVSNL